MRLLYWVGFVTDVRLDCLCRDFQENSRNFLTSIDCNPAIFQKKSLFCLCKALFVRFWNEQARFSSYVCLCARVCDGVLFWVASLWIDCGGRKVDFLVLCRSRETGCLFDVYKNARWYDKRWHSLLLWMCLMVLAFTVQDALQDVIVYFLYLVWRT